MEKETIKRMILDARESLQRRRIIKRDLVVDAEAARRFHKVIAISGPRRAGKTSYLYQLATGIGCAPESVVLVDFSEIILEGFQAADFELLYRAQVEMHPDVTPWFFLDEIQEVPGYEKGLQLLLNRGCPVFITGSSSRMFAQDLASTLRGKVLVYPLYPLSFPEYLRFRDIPVMEALSTREESAIVNALDMYLRWGGFPEIALAESEETRVKLIHSYIDIMLFRDIVERNEATNIPLLKSLLLRLMKSFTKEISVHKWYNDFRSQGMKISKDTLYRYLSYFDDSLFFSFLSHLEKGASSRKKVYMIDNGLCRIIREPTMDWGKLLENRVYWDLKQRFADIRYLRTASWEVYFVAGDTAWQVTHSLGAENAQRELSGLREALKRGPMSRARLIVQELSILVPAQERISIRPYWESIRQDFWE